MFEALLWLFIKHFICDFPLQAHPWFHLNKSRYGHASGLIHAALHGGGTYIVLSIFKINDAGILAVIDLFMHYHIDWAKMHINKKFNLSPDNGEWFWLILGIDQFLHHLTYFAIIWWAFHH